MKNKIHLVVAAFIFGLFISLCSSTINAQGWGTIDSLKIIPDSVTTTSTVQVSCFATFGYGSCFIIDTVVSISGTTILVQANHMIGMLTVICNSADTVTLGSNFSPGVYTVIYNLDDSGIVALDSDTLYFTIPELINGKDEITSISNINIFPNPALNVLTVRLLNNELASIITITDVLGREIYSQKVKQNSEIINLKSFSSGVYFVNVFMKNGAIVIQRFVME